MRVQCMYAGPEGKATTAGKQGHANKKRASSQHDQHDKQPPSQQPAPKAAVLQPHQLPMAAAPAAGPFQVGALKTRMWRHATSRPPDGAIVSQPLSASATETARAWCAAVATPSSGL